jgi:hypothetical protein
VIPVWVQRVPSIWIAVIQGLDPRMPPGAISLQIPQVRQLLESGTAPVSVARAWIQGADVEHPDDASSEVRALANRLRVMLPEACRPYVTKVGADFGMPKAGAAMAGMPGIPQVQQLADAVLDPHPDGVPRLGHEARLLRALMGL